MLISTARRIFWHKKIFIINFSKVFLNVKKIFHLSKTQKNQKNVIKHNIYNKKKINNKQTNQKTKNKTDKKLTT